MQNKPSKKFYIATDHAGYALKTYVKEFVLSLGHTIIDLGPDSADRVDYPDFAKKCANAVIEHPGSFGILICGTGIGISIAANKIPGIRAALCHDTYTARLTREHNDANILCFGERIVGKGVIEDMLRVFADTEFEGGRHGDRVDKIEACTLGKVLN